MSEIIKTEAVVLKSMKYRDTSKIVTLYTRDFGKVSTIVKGARQAKNKYGSSLEPMSYVSTVFYKKEGRELQTLTQCDVVRPFRTLSEDLEKMSVGLTIIELVNIVAHEEEKNIPLSNLLIGALNALNEGEKNPTNFLYAFEIHIARILGFGPTLDRCASCKRPLGTEFSPEDEIPFHHGQGGPLCGDCSGSGGEKYLLTRRSLLAMQQIAATADFADLPSVSIEKKSREEIGSFLWNYLRFHISGMRSLRTEKVFAKILSAS